MFLTVSIVRVAFLFCVCNDNYQIPKRFVKTFRTIINIIVWFVLFRNRSDNAGRLRKYDTWTNISVRTVARFTTYRSVLRSLYTKVEMHFNFVATRLRRKEYTSKSIHTTLLIIRVPFWLIRISFYRNVIVDSNGKFSNKTLYTILYSVKNIFWFRCGSILIFDIYPKIVLLFCTCFWKTICRSQSYNSLLNRFPCPNHYWVFFSPFFSTRW